MDKNSKISKFVNDTPERELKVLWKINSQYIKDQTFVLKKLQFHPKYSRYPWIIALGCIVIFSVNVTCNEAGIPEMTHMDSAQTFSESFEPKQLLKVDLHH